MASILALQSDDLRSYLSKKMNVSRKDIVIKDENRNGTIENDEVQLVKKSKSIIHSVSSTYYTSLFRHTHESNQGKTITAYLDECKKLNIKPDANFLRSIKEKETIGFFNGNDIVYDKVAVCDIYHCDELGIKAIAAALKVNTTFTSINMHWNNFGAVGAKEIATVLKNNAAINSVSFYACDIGDDGAIAIADALKVNCAVKYLDLQGNVIGAKGAEALANALKKNNTLKTINLTGSVDAGTNHIGDKGAIAFAEMMKVNKALAHAYFQWNGIGDEGAVAFGEAFKSNNTIVDISLNGVSCENGCIGDRGAKALADGLKVNQSIKYVDLRLNNIGQSGTEELWTVNDYRKSHGAPSINIVLKD
jgi:hypothetical protein